MKTTFSRTFFTVAVLLLVSLLVVGTIFQVLVKDYLEDTVVRQLTNQAGVLSSLASAYDTEGSLGNPQFLLNLSVTSEVTQADAVICGAKGQILICSDSPWGCVHQGLSVSEDFLQGVYASGCTVKTGLIRGLYEDARYVVAVPIRDSASGENIGLVLVSSPVADTQAVLQRISQMFLLVSLAVIVLGMVLSAGFARTQANPIREVADAAIAFGHGDMTARVRVSDRYPSEVRNLAVSFNNMASSIQKSEYQRQEFVANVSHELKTPMTTIGGYIDGMLDGTIPPEKQRHYMMLVSEETKRLSRLVRSMLDISRLQDQGGLPPEKKARFDLEECAGQVLITFEKKITDKLLEVDVQMPEHPVYTFANRDYITQVIYNLLDNAVKFCPQGGELGLTIREGGSKAYVTVSNTGDTIPPEELPLVFDRFHKLDKSRSQNRDGWGLGLYIVKTIVCSHGEDISVTSKDGRTEFTFTMPLVVDASGADASVERV